MRHRSLILIATVLAIVASACASAVPDQPAADRAVGEESPPWDVDQAIQRTLIVEAALEDGLSRSQAACVIDTTVGAGDFTLADLADVDLTTNTSSSASPALAAVLADSLIDCGPSLRAYLNTDIPGSSSIPASRAVENDCLTNAYVEAWREAYTNRFSGATVVAEATEGRIPEIADVTTDMIAACEAGGAVILGASSEGNLETFALTTLEWTCLDSRIGADAFMPAFPFPDEPGDALARLGEAVQADVAFCESWAAAG
jgi:hypothetical protein